MFTRERELGLEQGLEQAKVKIARNLISMNMNPIDISKATGLTIDEINKINNNE